MILLVANRLVLMPAAELLGGWPEIQPVCIYIVIMSVPALKMLKNTCIIGLRERRAKSVEIGNYRHHRVNYVFVVAN